MRLHGHLEDLIGGRGVWLVQPAWSFIPFFGVLSLCLEIFFLLLVNLQVKVKLSIKCAILPLLFITEATKMYIRKYSYLPCQLPFLKYLNV